MNRLHIGVLAMVALLLMSGCLGFLTGKNAYEFESSPAKVSDSTLNDTGYEQKNVSDVTMNKTFTYQGESREVRVTNWAVQYDKSVDMGMLGKQKAAQFVLFTTPQVDMLGKSFNPVGQMSDRQLANKLLSQYSGVENVSIVGEQNIIMLGKGTTVTKFSTTARMAGASMDLYVHMTRVKHGGDYVIAVGVYPQKVDEEQEVLTMMRNVTHDDGESE